ncbi:MAG: ATP-binding protein [Myxococcota bacterium]
MPEAHELHEDHEASVRGFASPGEAPPSPAWQHTLMEIDRVRLVLEARVAAGGLAAERAIPPEHDLLAMHIAELVEALEARTGAPPPLELLRRRFGLRPAEYDLVVLTLAMELDERSARLLGTLRGGARHGFVDLQLGLALFADSPLEAATVALRCDPDGVLFRAGLVSALPISGFPPYRAGHCWRAERHLLHFALGQRALGALVAEVATHVVPSVRRADLPGLGPTIDSLGHTLTGFYRLAPRKVDADALERRLDGDRALVASLVGVAGSGRRMAARAACQAAGRALIEIDGARLAGRAMPLDDSFEAVFREAELYSEVIHLRNADELLLRHPAAAALLADLAHRHPVALILSHETQPLPQPLEGHVLLRLRTPLRLVGEQPREAWLRNVPAHAAVDAGQLAALADHHPLLPGQIARALRLATMWCAMDRKEAIGLNPAVLGAAAAAQRPTTTGELTTPDSSAGSRRLADVVLSTQNRGEVEAILQACMNRMRVMRDWGFDKLLKRGSGIICLFDGPPGTGKTLTAEIIAHELQLELHQINVGRIVDKYIGETEKNLEQLFARVVPERTLLLFDEADSLFGTRVKVSSSTDRYANMAINTLLQLIERYAGVVVLTTNLKESMDPAFERRITYKVKFDKPDREARLRLWKAHLPPEAPLAGDVDLELLADDFDLAGGNIKNIVLRAALACAADGRITQAALDAQARREASTMGMLVRR